MDGVYSDVSCENTVFWCILMYSEMYSCILWFAIGIHCALCILVYCILYVSYMYLSRGWNTLGYTQNTLRYTYPHPHTWPDPCASGIHQDTTGYNRIHPLVRIAQAAATKWSCDLAHLRRHRMGELQVPRWRQSTQTLCGFAGCPNSVLCFGSQMARV